MLGDWNVIRGPGARSAVEMGWAALCPHCCNLVSVRAQDGTIDQHSTWRDWLAGRRLCPGVGRKPLSPRAT